MKLFGEMNIETFSFKDLEGKDLRIVCGIDPATGKDRSCGVICGQDMKTNKIYVLGQWDDGEMSRWSVKTLATIIKKCTIAWVVRFIKGVKRWIKEKMVY